MCTKYVCALMLPDNPGQRVHCGGGQNDIALFSHDWTLFKEWQLAPGRSW